MPVKTIVRNAFEGVKQEGETVVRVVKNQVVGMSERDKQGLYGTTNLTNPQIQERHQQEEINKLQATDQIHQELQEMQGKKKENRASTPPPNKVDMEHHMKAENLGQKPQRPEPAQQEPEPLRAPSERTPQAGQEEVVMPGKSSGRKGCTRNRMQPRRKLKTAETRGGSGNRE